MNQNKSRIFNTAGPCNVDEHYMLPALERLSAVEQLILNKKYFVLKSPRQSGKTTSIQALADEINDKNRYHALYYSLNNLRQQRDSAKAGTSFVSNLNENLFNSQIPALNNIQMDTFSLDPTLIFQGTLSRLCRLLDKPLVIFFDEADSLPEEIIINFLIQLREGYVNRKKVPFPHSIAIIGMRPIRDYKYLVRDEIKSLGSGSPFNIAETITLSDFTLSEVGELYTQHTEATGQIFEKEAIERAWYWSEGQPWLVNALARQVVERDLNSDYSQNITATHINAAAEALILRRDTHIDSLLARLHEPRIKMVMEPVFTGEIQHQETTMDDTQTCLDLGLLKKGKSGALGPANPIYAEVMVRYLTSDLQEGLPPYLVNRWMDGNSVDMTGLLKDFQKFWRENSEIWTTVYKYNEEAPHFSLQAFLQRVMNGGARVVREYALGRRRVDLCITYKDNLYLVEIKIKGNDTLDKAIEQLSDYMDKAGVRESWLVFFDRDPKKSWDDKIGWEERELKNGHIIHLVGC